MDIQEFKRLKSDNNAFRLAITHYNEILNESVSCCTREQKCIVIMEELAELQQMVSKFARGELDDIDELIEEMADVEICIGMLQKLIDLNPILFKRAVMAKMYREGVRRGVK